MTPDEIRAKITALPDDDFVTVTHHAKATEHGQAEFSVEAGKLKEAMNPARNCALYPAYLGGCGRCDNCRERMARPPRLMKHDLRVEFPRMVPSVSPPMNPTYVESIDHEKGIVTFGTEPPE